MYSCLRISYRPLQDAPVGNILFYSSEALWSAIRLGNVLLASPHMNFDVLMSTSILFISSVAAWIAGTLPLRSELPGPNVSVPYSTPVYSQSNPVDAITFWDWMNFSFVAALYPTSARKRLDGEDAWSLSPYFLHKNLFTKYLKYIRLHPKRSLIHFLLSSNSLDIILDIAIELYKAVAGFIPPYALKRLLAILANPMDNRKALLEAHFWAFVTLAANMTFAQCDLFQGWHTRRCYERTRGQIFCALHYKALKRRDFSGKTSDDVEDGADEKGADLGKVVNLMSSVKSPIPQCIN